MRGMEDASAWSVSQCMVFLKKSFRDKDFENLETVLTSKFEDLKHQLVLANTNYENQRLQRIAAEEDQMTMCECALFRAKAVSAEMKRDELQEEVKRLKEQSKELLPDLRTTILELKAAKCRAEEELKSSSEDLASARRRIHELECENKKLEADWRKKCEDLHDRVFSLEKVVEDLRKQETVEKEMAEANEHLSNGGNGRSPSQSIVEIADSDDEPAAEVISNAKATMLQSPARSSGSSHPDCEKGSRGLKRRRDEAYNPEEYSLSSRGDKVDRDRVSGPANSQRDNKSLRPCEGVSGSKTLSRDPMTRAILDGSVNDCEVSSDSGDKVDRVSGPANSQRDNKSLKPCEGVSGSKTLSRDLMSRVILDGSVNDCEVSSDSGDSDSDFDCDRWTLISEMVDGFKTSTELCMQAVCALHRMEKNKKRSPLGLRYGNWGFDKSNAARGTALAEFLMDGDPHGRLRKSVTELEAYDPKAANECKSIAMEHSEQLFEMYKRKEDVSFRQFVNLTAP